MFKHISWKRIKSNIKLISIVVIVLMVLQLASVYLVTAGKKTERFNAWAGEAFLGSVVSLDEKLDYLKDGILFITSLEEVYQLMMSEQVVQEDLFRFRSMTTRLHAGMFLDVTNCFIYNEQTQMVYSSLMWKMPLDKLPPSKTKSIILGEQPYNNKMMFYVDVDNFLMWSGAESNEQVLRFCYFPSRQSSSCLFLDVSLGYITEAFEAYQADFASEIFAFGEDDSLLHGSDMALGAALQRDLSELADQNFNEPVFRKYGGKRYLVLRQSTTRGDIQAYSLIPDSAISIDHQETKALLLANASLVIAVCVILVIFIILKALSDASKENIRHQQIAEQDRQQNQFMQSKQYIANCLFRPGEQDIRKAKEYIAGLLSPSGGTEGSLSGVMVLRFEICGYETFLQKYSSKDVLLYKYGIVNICEEILNNHLRALAVYERDAEIIFVLIPGAAGEAVCEKACRECQKAVYDYIAENLSAFLSARGPIEELPELNGQTLQLAEYRFLLSEPLLLHAGYLQEVSCDSGQKLMEYLEQFCIALEQADVESEIESFFAWVSRLRLEDAKNALWMLMFRLYNTGKKAARSIDNIENLVLRFNRICNLSEMKAFFCELCTAVYPRNEETGSSKNHMVQKVLSIIERRFQEPGFCSDHVAEEMGLSKAYLSRKFRLVADMSISETINERRLEEFARLLVSTDQNVKSIIDAIGGVNHNYYMIMFKKKFQMTPTEYRKSFKKQTEA
ncbi:MAG: helix-turn-helix transcriptional regulator [Ruminococcaceae bacterium]|nr:helix-turn-helix transcriptional regulator [Oscillospiraceae bacterium]